jgi:hypothetical protein
MEGFLWKKGDRGVLAGYKRRWFSMDESELRYFEDSSERKLLGSIDLSRLVRVSRGNPSNHRKRAIVAFAANVLELEIPGRTYVLIPEREADLHGWVEAMALHAERSTFRGDLKRIAGSGGSATEEGLAASPGRRGAGRTDAPSAEPDYDPAGKASVDRSRASSEDEFGPAVIGPGRSGAGGASGGGGFFSRMASPAPSAADHARIKELEEGYAKTKDEVVQLRQELATIRSSTAASPSKRGQPARKGSSRSRAGSGKGLGASLLDRRGSRDNGDEGEENWGEEEEEEDEEEVLPGCGCCGGRCTCKVFFLVIVNIIVIVTGLGIAAAGAYALSKQAQFKLILSPLVMEILLSVGIGFMLIGGLGSYAATRFHTARGKCLLLPYIIFMLILTIGELGGGVFLFIDVDNIKVPAAGASATGTAEKNLDIFLDDTYRSCCNSTLGKFPKCDWIPDTVSEGCPLVGQRAFEERVTGLVRSELAPIAGAAAGLVVLHGAAMWFALTLLCPCCSCACLTCCCRRKKKEGDDQDDDGPTRRASSGRGRSSSRAAGAGRGRKPSRKGSMYADFDD